MTRKKELEAFLTSLGWQDAVRQPIMGDASTRSYQRLTRGGACAILMDAPVTAEAAACPPEASVEERKALGYNALARLAGPNLHAFVQLADLLRKAGLHAPAIYGADATLGFCLIEDLGDNLFARVLAAGDGGVQQEHEVLLYGAAVDALAHLHQGAIICPASADYTLLDYDETAMLNEAALLIDWYWPFVKGASASPTISRAYWSAWEDCLSGLSPRHTLVLRDYHAENLLWLADADGGGLGRVGVIDFQDGLFGHGAYDLASLLEDARRAVAPALAKKMKARYTQAMTGSGRFSVVAFEQDYALLAAQRNAKILGIFARLVERDEKPRYLEFMPLVQRYFAADLTAEVLAPVRDWAEVYFPELLNA